MQITQKIKRYQRNNGYVRMKQIITVILFFILFSLPQTVDAQSRVTGGLIRIAGPVAMVDTVSVWGEVRNAGRYLMPKGTTVAQMLSYANGPISYRTRETILDWSDIRIEVTISSYNVETGESDRQFFTFIYKEEFPIEMRQTRLRNDDIMTVEIKRKPVLRDYINVIAPSLSLVFSFWALYDRINR